MTRHLPRFLSISVAMGLFTLGCMCGDMGDTIGERISDEVSDKIAEEIAEELAEAASGAENIEFKGDEASGSFSMKTDDGEITLTGGEGSEVPADFPLAIYKGAEVVSSMSLKSSTSDSGFQVGLRTDAAPQKVAAFYKQQLESWDGDLMENEMTSDGKKVFTLMKENDKNTAMITVTPDEDGSTLVAMMVGVKQTKE